MSQTVAHPVDNVIPHAPVRPWELALPTPPRMPLASLPGLARPVLQVAHRVITRRLLGQAGGFRGLSLVKIEARATRQLVLQGLAPASHACGGPQRP